jgi:hypothetical protein
VKIQFLGTPDPDDAADGFILAFLASRNGSPVSAQQLWKRPRSRGFALTGEHRDSPAGPEDGIAIAEIGRRLQERLKQGLVDGEARPESFTNEHHFWTIGNSHAKG